MIYWLNDISRGDSLVPPIHRLGFLDGKRETIHRCFDHISFSLFWGCNLDLSLQVGKNLYRQYAPCYTLGLPGDFRIVTPNSPVDEFYCVYESEYVQHFFKHGTEDLPRLRTLTEAPVVAHYVQMLRTLVENHPISPCLCQQIDLLCHGIFLAAFYDAADGWGDSSMDKRILKIENELRRRYRENVDYEDLARRNRLSFSSLRRLWRLHHDKTPHEFIMELRNHEACELLKDPMLSISDVAQAVGYDDPQYFARFFARLNHCSPSQYRQANKK